MVDAIHDENRTQVWLAASYLDGTTAVPIKIDSSTGRVLVDTTHTLAVTPTAIDRRDNNRVPFICAVSSTDGLVYPLYADPATGGVLIST